MEKNSIRERALGLKVNKGVERNKGNFTGGIEASMMQRQKVTVNHHLSWLSIKDCGAF